MHPSIEKDLLGSFPISVGPCLALFPIDADMVLLPPNT
jgi:hypothetical protein